jgi:RHS repeat-associated protein
MQRTITFLLVIVLVTLSSIACVHAQLLPDPGLETPEDPGIDPTRTAAGDTQVYQEYAERMRSAEMVTPLGSDVFGEGVNLFDGQTTFSNVDIDVPGNNALPVQLSRRLKIARLAKVIDAPYGGLGNWDIDVPYLSGVFPGNDKWGVVGGTTSPRCSSSYMPSVSAPFSRADVWTGNTVHIPGAGDNEIFYLPGSGSAIYPADGQPHLWTTSNYDAFTCTPTTSNSYGGEGFVMKTSKGLKYTFDAGFDRNAGTIGMGTDTRTRIRVYLLATKIEDRYGNRVEYTYSAKGLPTSIKGFVAGSSVAEREITLTYSTDTAPRLLSANAHGRTWNYEYETYGVPAKQRLKTVLQPGASDIPVAQRPRWTYTYSNDMYVDYQDWDGNAGSRCVGAPEESGAFTLAIAHPAGATGTFAFTYGRFQRSGVRLHAGCVGPSETGAWKIAIPNFSDGFSLVSKTVTGTGLTSMEWGYHYGSEIGDYQYCHAPRDPVRHADLPECSAAAVALERGVVVTEPDGSKKNYRFGVKFGVNHGRLLGTATQSAAGEPLSTTGTTYYETPPTAFPDIYGIRLGSVEDPLSQQIRPVLSESETRQGVTFTKSTNPADFDAYARPLKVTRSSTLGSRTETTVYKDKTDAAWLLGNIESVIEQSTGQVMEYNAYHPTTLDRISETRFGKLQRTMQYRTDGTLEWVRDGLNKQTTLSSYHRAVPRRIDYHDGTYQTATVNDHGQVTSVSNELFHTTNYDYRDDGRLYQIRHPTADSVAWNATQLSFVPATGTDYGFGTGRWKQTIDTGAGRKTTVFDALWRPLLTVSEDTTRATTTSYIAHRFDHAGRATFVSYPKATQAETTIGTSTTYDGLGRAILVDAASELGTLTTTIQYVTGFKQIATNAEGHATTTEYQAFDDPAAAVVAKILSPEGATTTIARDIFGKPQSITRSGLYGSRPLITLLSNQRSYVYDEYQRLCKTIEPESGATIVDYDAAGNVVWSASGLALSSLSDCQRASVMEDKKIKSQYDARNRLTTTSYGDGSPGIARTYTADGLPLTVNSDGANWTYGYNKRRLLTTEILSIGTQVYGLTWGYSVNGHREKLTYPDGEEVAFAPTALGAPTQVGSYATGVTTQPSGAFKEFTYGNGIAHTLTSNARGLPVRVQDQGVLNDVYTYDRNANVKRIEDQHTNGLHTRSMTYDGLDRLTGAEALNLWGQSTYAYDPLDNLRSSRVGARNCTHTINPTTFRLDALTGCTQAMSYAYDTQGNVIQRGTQAFVFDRANRMSEAAGKATYRYDGWGRRTYISETSGAARYQVYSQDGQLLHEVDVASGKATNYAYLGTSLLARNEVSAGSPPLAPASITVNTLEPNSGNYTVNWSSSTGANRYVLQEQIDAAAWVEIYNGSQTLLSIVGKPSGTYVYRAQACAGSSCGAYSATASITIQIGGYLIPGVPTPDVNPSTTGNYTLTWTLATDPRNWYFEIQEHAGDSVWASVGNLLTQRTWSTTGKPNGTYSYRVRACLTKSQMCGDWSAVGSVEVNREIIPPTPTLSATPNPSTTGDFTVSWTASAGSNYELQRQNGSNWTRIYLGSTPSQVFGNQSNGTSVYRVQACVGSVCSNWSASYTVTVAIPSVPAVPGRPTATPNPSTTGSYEVSWLAVSTATRYELYEQAPGAAASVLVQNGAGLSRAFSGRPNGDYEYAVKACNATGCSAESIKRVAQVRQPLPLVTGVTASPLSSTNGNYTVSWNPVAGADYYTLLEYADLGGNAVPTQVSGTTKSFTGQGNGTYRYYVKACDLYGVCGGTGPESNSVVVTVAIPSAPATPTNLTGPSTRVQVPPNYTVGWSVVPNATGYIVEETPTCPSGPNNQVVTLTETVTQNNFTGPLTACRVGGNQGFRYRVKACANSLCSAWSAFKDVQVTITGVESVPDDALRLVAERTYLHTDALGSPVAETNAAGAIVKARMAYEPYGAPASGIYTNGPGYTGHVTDANTGLSYMQQRYYDPIGGRFLSMDPVLTSHDNGGNFNRYWYANNNPYKFTDPDGRFAHIAAGALVGAVFGGGSYAYSSISSGTFSWGGLAGSTGTGAVVGGLTAAVPVAAAGLGLGGTSTTAVTLGAAGTIGAVGNVANQAMTSDAPINFTEAGIAGLANAVGLGVGQALSGPAKSAASSTISQGVDGLPTPSISGKMFWVGQQAPVVRESAMGAQIIQDTAGAVTSEIINKSSDPLKER